MINFQGLNPQESIRKFCQMLIDEMNFRESQYLDTSYLKLKYENNLFDKKGKTLPVGIIGYSERLRPLILELKRSRTQTRILDGGCGCGSEALLMSLFGRDVTGIDLVPYRVEFAQSRIPYYQSLSNDILKVHFINSNIFDFLESAENFDIIWLMESISHIHPAEKFIELSFKRLNQNGLLIISDSNAMNPVSWYRSFKIRGALRWYTYREEKQTRKGRAVEVAEERIFSSRGLKKNLTQAGFTIKNSEISGFMGSFFLPKKLRMKDPLAKKLLLFQSVMKKTPIINLFGSNFTIVAEKS